MQPARRILSQIAFLAIALGGVACADHDATFQAGPLPTPPALTGDTSGILGRVLYVGPDGSPGATGQSPGDALDSIAAALEQANPSDAVFVLPGVYHESIELYEFGGAGGPITLRGTDTGAILDGAGDLPFGLWCTNCANVIVENLEFRGYSDFGLGFAASDSLRLSNLSLHDNGFAPQLRGWGLEGYGLHIEYGRAVVIESSVFYANGPNPQTRRFLMGTGINVFTCQLCQILDNQSYRNTGGGILVEDSVGVLVAGNEVYENDLDASVQEWWDGGLWVDGGRDITVRDNIFRDNLGPGIQLSDEDNQRPGGYVLENNVSTGNYFGLYVWNFSDGGLPGEDVLRMQGNDFSGNSRLDRWVEGMVCPPDNPCD